MTQALYRLPAGSLTVTRHSTDECREIAQDGLILLSEAGSRLHGINVGSDDQDLQGVCVEPPEVMLGLREFSMYEYRSKPVGVRSGRGDTDLNVYGLAKWSRLVMNGNPSHLLPLFAPESKIDYMAWPGRRLRENRHLFLAKSHANKFLGYLGRQRKRMLGELSQRTNRPELVEAYGFDTKFATHAMRIALQGAELIRTGDITLPMPEAERNQLIGFREGELPTIDDALAEINLLERHLVRQVEVSPLPAWPDYDGITKLLTDIYRTWWEEKER